MRTETKDIPLDREYETNSTLCQLYVMTGCKAAWMAQ